MKCPRCGEDDVNGPVCIAQCLGIPLESCGLGLPPASPAGPGSDQESPGICQHFARQAAEAAHEWDGVYNADLLELIADKIDVSLGDLIQAGRERLDDGDPRKIPPHSEDPEPVHAWFGLTYSAYFVLPRSALQSMPKEWQSRFIRMIKEVDDAFGHLASGQPYRVGLVGGGTDPLKDYERGRRRLARKGGLG